MPAARSPVLGPAHDALVCVAMPAFAVSAAHGQLDGRGLEGFYRAGRRLLGRLRIRVGGVEPLPVQGRQAGADRVRFVATVRTGADPGPDPGVVVERVRHASGIERITLRSSVARPLRLTVEAELGTDLAELAAVATGGGRAELPASVHDSGLRWSLAPEQAPPARGSSVAVTGPPATGHVPATRPGADRPAAAAPTPPPGAARRASTAAPGPSASRGAPARARGGAPGPARGTTAPGSPGGPRAPVASVVTADPPPADMLASAGLLRWEVELPPGAARTIELRIGGEPAGPVEPPPVPWSPAAAGCDDPRVAPLLAAALDDLRTLLLRDPAHPADVHLAAGVPWRCGLAPADALWAARMLLPLGTRLAAATLRAIARARPVAPAPGAPPEAARLPGTLRDSGPHLPPAATGVEATLLFPAVLAEARHWGLPERDVEQLLPTAERCLRWLRTAAADRGYVPDPPPGGPVRCETQAHAHRAALLGARLLDACGRPGGDEWRQWAADLCARFRTDFWVEDVTGGRPAAALAPDGRPLAHLGSPAAHLLPVPAPGDEASGLLDKAQLGQLARLLGSPALDSGWGLRSLGAKEPGFNPFGHRAGAVHVHDTAVAVRGLFTAGYEKEAGGLLRGLVDAAEHVGHRLSEMFAGEQRTAGAAPVPHPAACRPAALAAASAVHLLTALTGVVPDVPVATVAAHPPHTAPLGALQLTGWQLAGEPFAIRVSRLGLAVVEEAAAGLQLGS